MTKKQFILHGSGLSTANHALIISVKEGKKEKKEKKKGGTKRKRKRGKDRLYRDLFYLAHSYEAIPQLKPRVFVFLLSKEKKKKRPYPLSPLFGSRPIHTKSVSRQYTELYGESLEEEDKDHVPPICTSDYSVLGSQSHHLGKEKRVRDKAHPVRLFARRGLVSEQISR